MVISFVSTGRGAGKTLLAVNAAGWFSRTRRTLLLDAGEGARSLAWARGRECLPFGVARFEGAEDRFNQSGPSPTVDMTFIDGPSLDLVRKIAVLRSSDVAVFVLDTAEEDIDEAVELLRSAAREASPTGYARVAFLASRTITGSRTGARLRRLALRHGFPMLMSELHIRPVYASAHAIDQTIFEHAPQSDAATELECVLVEIESMMLPRFRSLGTFAS